MNYFTIKKIVKRLMEMEFKANPIIPHSCVSLSYNFYSVRAEVLPYLLNNDGYDRNSQDISIQTNYDKRISDIYVDVEGQIITFKIVKNVMKFPLSYLFKAKQYKKAAHKLEQARNYTNSFWTSLEKLCTFPNETDMMTFVELFKTRPFHLLMMTVLLPKENAMKFTHYLIRINHEMLRFLNEIDNFETWIDFHMENPKAKTRYSDWKELNEDETQKLNMKCKDRIMARKEVLQDMASLYAYEKLNQKLHGTKLAPLRKKI